MVGASDLVERQLNLDDMRGVILVISPRHQLTIKLYRRTTEPLHQLLHHHITEISHNSLHQLHYG